jgi:hypothetical protein
MNQTHKTKLKNSNMTIEVIMEVSETSGVHTFTLEDLGLTENEWNNLNEEQKRDKVQMAIFELPDQPYWMLESFVNR